MAHPVHSRGTDLSLVWDDLSYNQQLVVARKLGDVVRQLLSLESPVASILEARVEDTETAKPPLIVPFELREQDGYSELLENLESEKSDGIGALQTHDTTLDLFKSLLSHWRVWAAANSCDDNDREVKLWDASSKLCVRWTHCSFLDQTRIVYATSIYTLVTSWSGFNPTIHSDPRLGRGGHCTKFRQLRATRVVVGLQCR